MTSSPKKFLLAVAVSTSSTIIPQASSATTYKFTVTCDYDSKVVEWRTGTIDPGREALRVSTGSNHPGCSVSHFDPSVDSSLPIEVRDGGAAVIQGIPLVGEIAKELFGGLF